MFAIRKPKPMITENGFKYIEKGEGEVLFLLHGLFGALSNFSQVIDHFSPRYKVVFPFLPLYELPLLQSTVSGMVNHVSEFIHYKQYKHINILGNSLGGHIGQVYALKNLGNVNSLILTGSSGLFESSLGDGYPNKENKEYIRTKTAYTFYDPKYATDELVDEVFETVNNRAKALRVVTMAKSAVRHNLRNDLNKLDIPVKLIWGKNDTITPPFVAEEFQKLLPNSSLSFIDECGHAAMMEKPQEFNTILDAFLTSLYYQKV